MSSLFSCRDDFALKALTCIPLVGIFVPKCNADIIGQKMGEKYGNESHLGQMTAVQYVNDFQLAGIIREALTIAAFIALACAGHLDMTGAIIASSILGALMIYRGYRLYQSTHVRLQSFANFTVFAHKLIGCGGL